MQDDVKYLLYFLIYLLMFGLPIYGIFHLPKLNRKIRMKRLAKKYNLKFDRMINLPILEFSPSGKEKRNRISGVINNKKIEVYDYISSRELIPFFNHLVPSGRRGRVYEHHTVFIYNDNKKDVRGFLFGHFRVRIKEIEDWLSNL